MRQAMHHTNAPANLSRLHLDWRGFGVIRSFQHPKAGVSHMGWSGQRSIGHEDFAKGLYNAFVVLGDFDHVTADTFHIPECFRDRYAVKSLKEREVMCFAALMWSAETQPGLTKVANAFFAIVAARMAERGERRADNAKVYADSATSAARGLFIEPISWAEAWLSDFRDQPDNNDAFLFADHWQCQFEGYVHAIDTLG